MANEIPENIRERRKLGLELRQKYELYFLSLNFTLAGLSVQTAKPSLVLCFSVIEILGWVSFAASGGIGIWRVNTLWRQHLGHADYQSSLYDGGDENLENELQTLETRMRKSRIYQIGFFALGLALVMLSRAAALIQ